MRLDENSAQCLVADAFFVSAKRYGGYKLQALCQVQALYKCVTCCFGHPLLHRLFNGGGMGCQPLYYSPARVMWWQLLKPSLNNRSHAHGEGRFTGASSIPRVTLNLDFFLSIRAFFACGAPMGWHYFGNYILIIFTQAGADFLCDA